jgi:hypothetical protein
MQVSGTIKSQGDELYLATQQGNFKIHLTDKAKLSNDAIGLLASGTVAENIYPPRSFDGWILHDSLVIVI